MSTITSLENADSIAAQVGRALSAGLRYLERKQNADGWWKDYPNLPVGASDGWVTAYVGLAVAEATSPNGIADNENAVRAARWMQRVRSCAAGWGYNATVPADADSTAYTLLLLRKTGQEIRRQDVNWLLRHWRSGGGFATYLKSGTAWGVAHPDVTPVVIDALPDADKYAKRWSFSWRNGLARTRLVDKFINYSLANRFPDGSWPAYWWRTSYYSTFWNLKVLRKLGWKGSVDPHAVTAEDSGTASSAFDLAFLLGIALVASDRKLAEKFGTELLARQLEDGSWPEGENLRVTAQDCYRPWERAKGRLFVDAERLLTTASAVRMIGSFEQMLKQG